MLQAGDGFVITPMQTNATSHRRPVKRSSALAEIRGCREAQELLNIMRTGNAPSEALHRAMEGIRNAADPVRLRSFTLEIQHALKEGQRRASDLRELKRFTDFRARLQGLKGHLYRTDPADGPVTYFVATRGIVRPYVDLEAVQVVVATMEATAEGQRRRDAVRQTA